MTRHVGAVVLLAGLVLFGAAGCIGDDDPVTAPGVLQPADVATGRGPVDDITDQNGSSAGCAEVISAEGAITWFASAGYEQSFAVDGGRVRTGAWTRSSRQDAARKLDFLRSGVADCPPFEAPPGTIRTSRLLDAGPDRVRIETRVEGDSGAVVLDRVHLLVGDTIVAVGVIWDGAGPGPADPVALAAQAAEQLR